MYLKNKNQTNKTTKKTKTTKPVWNESELLSGRVEKIKQAKPILFAKGRYNIKRNGKGKKINKFHITVRYKIKITPSYEVTLGLNKCVQAQFPFLF